MLFHHLDPLSDCRWDALVASHTQASVFHQRGGMKALQRTYGYPTMALTTALPGARLSDALVFCGVKSWIRGRRLVSLPFSDHAELLLNQGSASFDMADWLQAECRQRKWRYVEFRPISGALCPADPMVQSQSFWLHTLDLTAST